MSAPRFRTAPAVGSERARYAVYIDDERGNARHVGYVASTTSDVHPGRYFWRAMLPMHTIVVSAGHDQRRGAAAALVAHVTGARFGSVSK